MAISMACEDLAHPKINTGNVIKKPEKYLKWWLIITLNVSCRKHL